MDPKTIEALRILSRVLSEQGRRFVLIGAMVPQILLDFSGIDFPESRETKDVDAVAQVGSWEDFEHVRERLLQEGFQQGKVAHEFRFDYAQVDLIPYGKSLLQGDKLVWPYGDNVMTAFGLEEALACASEHEIAPDLRLPVVSIPGLILTKVVAYMDRPEERARDLMDIINYFDLYEKNPGESRRFDYADAEIADKALTYEEAGAYLLGLEVAALANPGSLEIVRRFLDSIQGEYAPAISRILSEEKRLVDSDTRRGALYRLFQVFGAGIDQSQTR
jgi:predicted nucleotidyltransferase